MKSSNILSHLLLFVNHSVHMIRGVFLQKYETIPQFITWKLAKQRPTNLFVYLSVHLCIYLTIPGQWKIVINDYLVHFHMRMSAWSRPIPYKAQNVSVCFKKKHKLCSLSSKTSVAYTSEQHSLKVMTREHTVIS